MKNNLLFFSETELLLALVVGIAIGYCLGIFISSHE